MTGFKSKKAMANEKVRPANIDDETMLRAVNKWESTAPIELLLDIKALKEHMISEHGLKFTSWIGLHKPIVVDEKKYVMFLLRFGS
jgi:hypothetical protein